MKRRVLIAALALTACDQSSPPGAKPGATTPGASAAGLSAQLDQLAKTNASVVGYLYSAETPYIVATFDNGTLIWRTQGGANAVAKGRASVITEADRTCLGFEQKNPTMPDRGPERYLVCEAVDSIKHSNSLPRSQDYTLSSGTLFLEYDPPAGTGYAQLFYAKRTK
jgi:hypothetical protein